MDDANTVQVATLNLLESVIMLAIMDDTQRSSMIVECRNLKRTLHTETRRHRAVPIMPDAPAPLRMYDTEAIGALQVAGLHKRASLFDLLDKVCACVSEESATMLRRGYNRERGEADIAMLVFPLISAITTAESKRPPTESKTTAREIESFLRRSAFVSISRDTLSGDDRVSGSITEVANALASWLRKP